MFNCSHGVKILKYKEEGDAYHVRHMDHVRHLCLIVLLTLKFKGVKQLQILALSQLGQNHFLLRFRSLG